MGIIASTAQQGYAQELKSIADRKRIEGLLWASADSGRFLCLQAFATR
jgi:hypothetical protein